MAAQDRDTPKRVLFVDDEPDFVEPYVLELRDAGFEIQLEPSIDRALGILEEQTAPFDCVLLDVMMAPGESFSLAETQEGLLTGAAFYRRLLETRKELPVIVLTNNTADHVRKHLPPEARILWKAEVMPFQLVQIVEELLG